MKKYVFIDIDGTLFDHGSGMIPASALEALHKAKANGHELFICTGRPKPIVESSFWNLPITGIIYSGGTHIEINQKVIFQRNFPKKQMFELIEILNENQFDYTLEGIEKNLYTKGNFDWFKIYLCNEAFADSELETRFQEMSVLKLIEDAEPDDYEQITKIDVFAKNDQRIHDLIGNLPEGLDGFVYSSSIDQLIEAEILIGGISKASGIDEIIKYYGAKIEDTIAIGDSTNDMAMIEHAHIGIAMGNACEPLKEIADYVTAPVDQDGFYLALKHCHLI
ncbi:MAG: HAD family phosphatase [Erysipelotrichaceae bacterium]|nr:HAD family phosphatase [Erysipelotrichaceae bacterium]